MVVKTTMQTQNKLKTKLNLKTNITKKTRKLLSKFLNFNFTYWLARETEKGLKLQATVLPKNYA